MWTNADILKMGKFALDLSSGAPTMGWQGEAHPDCQPLKMESPRNRNHPFGS